MNKGQKLHAWHGHKIGGVSSPTYRVWGMMKKRCADPKYTNYAARGIRVCKRWHKFANFLADMGVRPDGLTIERKNNNKGYTPSNCRWATHLEQGRNRRTNVFYEFQGRRLILPEWARLMGVKTQVLAARLRLGWSLESTLTTKPLYKWRDKGAGSHAKVWKCQV